MKPILMLLDKVRPVFEPGGKLEKLYPLFEVVRNAHTSDVRAG